MEYFGAYYYIRTNNKLQIIYMIPQHFTIFRSQNCTISRKQQVPKKKEWRVKILEQKNQR